MSIQAFTATGGIPDDNVLLHLHHALAAKDNARACAAGRADAYDDHATLSTDELNVRATWIIDFHPDLSYVQGYAAYVKESQLSDALASGRTETRR